ncbi:voltage-dependent calcium channel gamma-8 subunit isoform X2 [Dendrobates tinctorius]|uniref:voltage-dependent calcium channel gamma-8 subunit isoform X2 n=1 Tax=Dendrobates tinctorius TaxID=92724 RepID=UPI003CC99816
MKCMRKLWMDTRPACPLTEKQLVTQHFNIIKRKPLSQLEMDQLHCRSTQHEDLEEQYVQSPEHPDPTLQLESTAVDLKQKILDKLNTINIRDRLPRLSTETPPDSMLEEANRALASISATITQANKLIYATASAVMEMLVYTTNKNNRSTCPPWKRRLEAKIKVTHRKVRQLTEIQKGVKIKNQTKLDKYKGLTPNEALETAKQRLTAHAARLGRYTRVAEAKKINALFSKEPSKVYSQLQSNNTKTATPQIAETEQYWKNIWKKEKTQNTSAMWLKVLKMKHRNHLEQKPFII